MELEALEAYREGSGLATGKIPRTRPRNNDFSFPRDRCLAAALWLLAFGGQLAALHVCASELK